MRIVQIVCLVIDVISLYRMQRRAALTAPKLGATAKSHVRQPADHPRGGRTPFQERVSVSSA